MPDDTYWTNTRDDLLLLVERLQAADALAIIRELVQQESEEKMAPLLAGMIRGYVGRRDDEQARKRVGL